MIIKRVFSIKHWSQLTHLMFVDGEFSCFEHKFNADIGWPNGIATHSVASANSTSINRNVTRPKSVIFPFRWNQFYSYRVSVVCAGSILARATNVTCTYRQLSHAIIFQFSGLWCPCTGNVECWSISTRNRILRGVAKRFGRLKWKSNEFVGGNLD